MTNNNYREVITRRLQEDWKSDGLINEKTTISYGLIAGNLHKNQEKEFNDFFDSMGWFFWGPSELKRRTTELAKKGYENNEFTITSKILNK